MSPTASVGASSTVTQIPPTQVTGQQHGFATPCLPAAWSVPGACRRLCLSKDSLRSQQQAKRPRVDGRGRGDNRVRVVVSGVIDPCAAASAAEFFGVLPAISIVVPMRVDERAILYINFTILITFSFHTGLALSTTTDDIGWIWARLGKRLSASGSSCCSGIADIWHVGTMSIYLNIQFFLHMVQKSIIK